VFFRSVPGDGERRDRPFTARKVCGAKSKTADVVDAGRL
jgi:hypothetical protein